MKKIIILSQAGPFVNILYNFLKKDYNIEKIFLEKPVSKLIILKRRIKNLGLFKVFGQTLFIILLVPLLRKEARTRYREIINSKSLDLSEIPLNKILNISSINNDIVFSEIKKIKPDLIIVSGTRLISQNSLEKIEAPLFNIHAGITPMYRGAHGAYWALLNNDKEHCGTTIHKIDAGIDTGNIIKQGIIRFTKKDNFTTYSLLQLIEGAQMLKDITPDLKADQCDVGGVSWESKLWYHPTLISYLFNRLFRGVK
jgi:methionyl-tRNA formyltransferase